MTLSLSTSSEDWKFEIHAIDNELASLESDVNVAAMRAQEEKKALLLKREQTHQDLMELSRNEPPFSLKQAVILSSNEVCEDCDLVRERENYYFQLNIEMSWCT